MMGGKFIMHSSLQKLSAVDKLFAVLRVITIIGGLTWLLLTPVAQYIQTALLYTFGFFCLYSIFLYIAIFLNPAGIRTIYTIAFFLDLIFLYLLVSLTGGFRSDFLLAFLLLIALHAFYFGLNFGLLVAALASAAYLFAGGITNIRDDWLVLSLRIAFFFLTGAAMGLLSRKEALDRERIELLNRELTRERNKLSQILQGIDAGLILLDRQRNILWMNQISEEWFAPAEEACSRRCHEVIWNGDAHCSDCPTMRCLESGKIETGEIEFTRNADDIRYFRITAAPLTDENGNIERVLELFQDVTEEKELQLHLIQSSKLAAVGELASGTAHEINNPLSAIAVCVQEIAETLAAPRNRSENKFDVDIRQNLDYIRNEIQRCKRITTGLLNLARKSENQKTLTDINQILRNVVMLVRYKARKEHKEIELKLSSGLPSIMGEPDALSQVFLNLLLNAIEFTPAGPTIQVLSGRHDETTIFVKIIDQGFGIPPQNLDKIFKPFFTTKPAGVGTGLGLPVSQRIVKSHGGYIEVESQLNKGSTFTVYLPVGGNGDEV